MSIWPIKILFVAMGGACGSVGRFLIVSLLRQYLPAFPWGTLAVNICGCLLAGGCLAYFSKVFPAAPSLYLFLMVGFFGGFTTFSAFSVETLEFFLTQKLHLALLNIFLNFSGSLLAVGFGFQLGKILGNNT
jgi:fluoride exporter